MLTFAIAYTVVGLAVVLYLAWLEIRQRRLLRTLESLQAQLDEQETEPRVSEAA